MDRNEFWQDLKIPNDALASLMIAIFDEECVSLYHTALALLFLLFGLSGAWWARSGGGTVDFQEFVGGLSAFSSRGGREEKLRCKAVCYHVHYNSIERFV